MADDNQSTIPIRKAQDVLRYLPQPMLSDGGLIVFSILQGSVMYGDPVLLQRAKHDIGVEFLRSLDRRQRLGRVLVENWLIPFETQTRFHFSQFELDLSVIRRELKSSHYLVHMVLHVLYWLHSAVPVRIIEELHSHLLLQEPREYDLKMALWMAHMLRCALLTGCWCRPSTTQTNLAISVITTCLHSEGVVYKTLARDQFLSVLGSSHRITFENLKSLPVEEDFMVQSALNVYAVLHGSRGICGSGPAQTTLLEISQRRTNAERPKQRSEKPFFEKIRRTTSRNVRSLYSPSNLSKGLSFTERFHSKKRS
ncbi:hypothetical protein LSH36_1007g00023 [Paralvinella palmiformis]|uniref:Uncharacterized protein n=1 Tax=Paralvinella palmiformis TaxID=53620 RepID=A0AAD9IWT1_9ANNE|nr:hypothetical protein LSH36_1007g00023 [Paralvinella palmiformis]